MDELSIIFSSPPASEVFYAGSIAFMLAYVGGLLAPHTSRSGSGRPVVRHGIPMVAAALVAAVVGIGVHRATVSTAAAAAHQGLTASVSPEQIHRSIDAAALPVTEVREPF
jgi:hypothetical protein